MLNSSLKSRVRRLEVQKRQAEDFMPLSAVVRSARALLEREATLPPVELQACREDRQREAERLAAAALTDNDEPGGPFGSSAYWRRLMQDIRRASARRVQPPAVA